MKFKILLILFFSVILMNCSNNNCKIIEKNGVKIFYNKNHILNKNYNIKFNQETIISGIDSCSYFEHPLRCDLDSKNNIYVLDNKMSRIIKFDKNGVFCKYIGKIGNGPGETRYANAMTILNDTIIVIDPSRQKALKYDISGNYLKILDIPNGTIQKLRSIGKNKLLCYNIKHKRKNDYYQYNVSIGLINYKFEIIKTLSKKEFNYIPKQTSTLEFMRLFTPFSINNNDSLIYIADTKKSIYNISVFNFSGKKIRSIKKSYRTIGFEDFELNSINNIIKKRGFKVDPKYKIPIKSIFALTGEILLVDISTKRTLKNINIQYLEEVYTRDNS